MAREGIHSSAGNRTAGRKHNPIAGSLHKDESVQFYVAAGQVIKRLREEAGLTQRGLAASGINISRTMVAQIETGKRMIMLDAAFAICRSLHVSMDDFIVQILHQYNHNMETAK